MTDLGDLIQRASITLRDSDGLFIQPEDLKAWANEGTIDLAVRLELQDAEVSGTFTGSSNRVSLPTGAAEDSELISVETLTLNGDDQVMFVDTDEFDLWVDSGSTPSPTIGRVFGNYIELFPTPEDGDTFTLRYQASPDVMVNNEDTFPLPTQFERKVISYMRYQAKLKDNDFNAAAAYLAEYEQGLPPVRTGKMRKHPQQITLQVEGNAFDTNPDAMHL